MTPTVKTIKQVVSRFTRYRPANADQAIRWCHVPLQYIKSGAFRHVFQIIGLPLVVKFPYCEDDQLLEDGNPDPDRIAMGVQHSKREMKALERILSSVRKYTYLHKYMPTVYYSNQRTGVIVMHKYTGLPNSSKSNDISEAIRRDIQDIFATAGDIHSYNLGKDERGNVVVFDLGCFGEDC